MAEASAGPGPLRLPPEVVEIATTLERAGHETWAVGGALRDLLLGIAETDVDLATAAPPEVVQSLFRRTVPVGLRYGTVGVLDGRNRLHEVTTFRQDVETDGRHAVVRYGVSLHDDLARRDFTINAIAYHPIREEWQDPHGGREDLRAGLVRAVGNPTDRFREDYLRILRALRFSARFGFAIEPVTWAAAISAAPGLAGLSAERVRDEWFKGLRTAVSLRRLVELWQEVGAAAVWLDGLAAAYPGPDPAPVQRDPVVLTTLLTADAAAVLRRLRASGEEIGRAHAMAGAVEPASTKPADVRRWLAAVGAAADDLLLLEWYRRGEDAPWAQVVAGIRARGEATARGALALSGHDLLGAGMAAGPQVGATLDRLLDLVLHDPGLNTKERLLDLVRSWN